MTLPEPVQLALDAAPAPAKPALQALFALDARLDGLARHTRDPLVAQMRLTWWYEALGRLDAAPAPPEPLLAALAGTLLPLDVSGAALATVAGGWDVLLEPRPLTDEAMVRHAAQRGGALFAAAAVVLGGAESAAVRTAGEAWALADLAARGDPDERQRAEAMAAARWREASARRWPRALRPLGVLALLGLLPLSSRDGTAGGVKAAWRLTRFRLTGS